MELDSITVTHLTWRSGPLALGLWVLEFRLYHMSLTQDVDSANY